MIFNLTHYIFGLLDCHGLRKKNEKTKFATSPACNRWFGLVGCRHATAIQQVAKANLCAVVDPYDNGRQEAAESLAFLALMIFKR